MDVTLPAQTGLSQPELSDEGERALHLLDEVAVAFRALDRRRAELEQRLAGIREVAALDMGKAKGEAEQWRKVSLGLKIKANRLTGELQVAEARAAAAQERLATSKALVATVARAQAETDAVIALFDARDDTDDRAVTPANRDSGALLDRVQAVVDWMKALRTVPVAIDEAARTARAMPDAA